MVSCVLSAVKSIFNVVDIKETPSKVLFLKFVSSDPVKADYLIFYFSARKKN